jgi:hypothetical protein
MAYLIEPSTLVCSVSEVEKPFNKKLISHLENTKHPVLCDAEMLKLSCEKGTQFVSGARP